MWYIWYYVGIKAVTLKNDMSQPSSSGKMLANLVWWCGENYLAEQSFWGG